MPPFFNILDNVNHINTMIKDVKLYSKQLMNLHQVKSMHDKHTCLTNSS